MTSPWTDPAATRRAQLRASSITLDIGDAIELSELLDYLAQWLGLADPVVSADLSRFAWDHGAIRSVRQDLVSFAQLLVFGQALVEPDPDHDSGSCLDSLNEHAQEQQR